MISDFSSYKVKIRDLEYVTPDGNSCTHTAAISFFDKNKKELFYIELGYIDVNRIYDKIKLGEPVNLDNCYVEEFSLSKYRKMHDLGPEDLVVINSFRAKNAIFDAVEVTDFSFASFSEKSVTFQNTAFIHGGVNFASSVFEAGKVNFNSCIFSNGNLNFSNVNFGHDGLNFKNAVIGTGFKDFQYAYFGNGDVLFANTSFGNGDISFINSNFGNGEVSFKVAIFGNGKIDFHYATFAEGDISFERAEFGTGRVDFRTVEFGSGKINFNRAEFNNGDVTFDESEMQGGKLTFKNANLGDGDFSFQNSQYLKTDVSFEKALFGKGVVSFYNSGFHTLSLKSCQLNNYFDLRVSEASLLDLNDTVVRDIIDLTPHDFEVKIKVLSMTGMRLLGRIYIDWRANHIKKAIYAQDKTSHWMKAEQFRTLKQNFNATGRYDDEDLAYIEFKRNESLAILRDGTENNKSALIWHYPAYWFKLWVFDKMGLYATSPMRVLVSVVFTYMALVLIQFGLPFIMDTNINCIAADADLWTRFTDTAYFSAITYLTIGYGDCSPLGILRFVAGVEGFIGVFMMSYFTVAFARKVLR
ncbi:MAG: two pore domain potassium channel family protein [Bacteroidia bacterium]|nr:two pore domain potassium channel family protein [Bacteroidia bacterium]